MSNDDNLKARQTESKKNAFKELTIIRDTIFWIDVVGEGQNENAIFARPFNDKEAFPQKLTSNKYNIKNNFHGYGGKSYKCINFKNNFYLIWIDQITKAVWFQIFKEAASNDRSQNKYLVSVQEPNQLSKSIDGNFDSSFVISENFFLYGICEINNRDYLFSLNLKKTKQDIHRLKKFKNFAGDLSSNTSASLLSWIEWDSPYMPWERNDLFFAQIDLDGEIQKIKKFSNKLINAKKNVSFFATQNKFFLFPEKNVIPVTHCGAPYSIKFLSILFLIKIFSISLTSKNNKFHHPELSSEHTKIVSLIQ